MYGRAIFERLALNPKVQEVGTYSPPHWVSLNPKIPWLAASQNTSLRLFLWTCVQNIRGWLRRLFSVHSPPSPGSPLCRWAELIKLYLSAASGTGSWPVQVPRGRRKKNHPTYKTQSRKQTNERMSSAFTGNYFHSASIKSNRFDPSSLPPPSQLTSPWRQWGEQGPDWGNERQATFPENDNQKPLCHSQRLRRAVKASEWLNWTILSGEIHSSY